MTDAADAVAARESALLAAMKASPGALTGELAAILGVGQGRVARRCVALAERGVLVKRRGRWTIAAPAIEEAAPAEEPTRWVRPIGGFVRDEQGEAFHVARFG